MSLWQLLNVLSIKLGKRFHMLCMLMYVVLGSFLIKGGWVLGQRGMGEKTQLKHSAFNEPTSWRSTSAADWQISVMAVYPSIFRSSKLQKVVNQCDLQVLCLHVWSLGREAEGSIFLGPWRQKVCLQSRCTRILRFQHRPALSWVPVAWIAETFSTSMFFWDIKLMHWKWFRFGVCTKKLWADGTHWF